MEELIEAAADGLFTGALISSDDRDNKGCLIAAMFLILLGAFIFAGFYFGFLLE